MSKNLRQNSLFGNLPKMSEATKELNKAIVQKTKTPKKSKTAVVRVGNGATNALAKKVSLLIETLKNRVEDKGEQECIRTEERFREYMQQVRDNKHLFPALDSETTGLDPIEDYVVGIGIYYPGTMPVYIPMKHTDLSGTLIENQISYEVMREELEKCIEAGVKFVFHNAIFDLRSVKNSLEMLKYLLCHWDTQTAGSYLNENERHGLKPLYDKYVSTGEDKSDTFANLFTGIPFNYVPIELGAPYAAKDPRITHELFKFQEPFLTVGSERCKEAGLEQAATFFHEVEMPLNEFISEMEDEGVDIDPERSKDLSEKYNEMLKDVQSRFNKYAERFDFSKLLLEQRAKIGNPINLNSPQQLSIIIYDYLGLKSVDRKSPRGTGEEVLEKLVSRNPEHKEFFDLILEFRGISKLLSTYIDKFPQIVKKKTNRVHGRFNPYGAKTGRFSSTDPNLQNIPARNREIRKMIKAPENFAFIGGDFSQQEPRVLAHLAYKLFGERKLLDAYLDKKDLYSWMASEVYKVPYEQCLEFSATGEKNPREYKARRDSVKDLVLGLMYGRSTQSVAVKLGISEVEAQKIVDSMFNEFPAIKKVVDHFMAMARENGFVQTVYGRKRRLPEYNLPRWEFVQSKDKSKKIEDEAVCQYYTAKLLNAWGRDARDKIWKDANSKGVWIIDNSFKISEAERQILNSVVQGTGADITKKAMVLIGQDKQLREWGFKLLLTVHDELIGKAPLENALKCSERMRDLMLKSTEDTIVVPMSVDVEIVAYWNGADITDELKKAS